MSLLYIKAAQPEMTCGFAKNLVRVFAKLDPVSKMK